MTNIIHRSIMLTVSVRECFLQYLKVNQTVHIIFHLLATDGATCKCLKMWFKSKYQKCRFRLRYQNWYAIVLQYQFIFFPLENIELTAKIVKARYFHQKLWHDEISYTAWNFLTLCQKFVKINVSLYVNLLMFVIDCDLSFGLLNWV